MANIQPLSKFQKPTEAPKQEQAAPLAVVEAPKPRFRVHLGAATPLTINPLECDAMNAEDAKQKFCEANGISGSVHEWKIDAI